MPRPPCQGVEVTTRLSQRYDTQLHDFLLSGYVVAC